MEAKEVILAITPTGMQFHKPSLKFKSTLTESYWLLKLNPLTVEGIIKEGNFLKASQANIRAWFDCSIKNGQSPLLI